MKISIHFKGIYLLLCNFAYYLFSYELIQKAHQLYGPCCKRRTICITIDLILRRYFPAELCFACTVINVWLLNGANYTTKIYTFSYILFCIVIMDITLLQRNFMCNYNIKWILKKKIQIKLALNNIFAYLTMV